MVVFLMSVVVISFVAVIVDYMPQHSFNYLFYLYFRNTSYVCILIFLCHVVFLHAVHLYIKHHAKVTVYSVLYCLKRHERVTSAPGDYQSPAFVKKSLYETTTYIVG